MCNETGIVNIKHVTGSLAFPTYRHTIKQVSDIRKNQNYVTGSLASQD